MNTRKKLLVASRGISRRLTGRGMRLMTAESFTGGLISSSITMTAGASDYFFEGIVCYNPQSKSNRLGVSSTSLAEYGAASCAVLRQMLMGLIDSGADIAIATTGNAGPGVQGEGAGICFVGCSTKCSLTIHKIYIAGNRQRVIEKGALCAMKSAIKLLDKDYGGTNKKN